ncbi:uncharacterized protein LOC130635747 [Hydractinia symbiolongicarpus]|uniref:uncharacterized protein LOC130635747 n=1 Tax=Hydractinia symbiolongicarpus TaxID=13093 RepID=UPI00254B47EA|nr:uncharacterized protein LOC130635747 [Hydractinia symbiolongicarpus]
MTALKTYLYICLTHLVMLKTVICGTVETVKTNLEVPVNQTAQLKWRVVPDLGEEISTAEVFVLGSPNVQIINFVSTLTTAGEERFGNRLSGSLTNGIYTLSIKKIEFNEKKSYNLKVVFYNALEYYPKNSTVVIKEVVGGPEACGITLNTSYAVNEGKQLSVTTEVCGNPKPVLTWKLQKELEYSYSTAVAPVNISIMRYRYVYKTRRFVTREDCGTKLVFNATGTNGMIKGETLIDVTFSPRKLQNAIFYKDNDCINGIWTREATGNCVLNYHLQFEGGKYIFNTSDTYYAVCNVLSASYVFIWASYKNKYGEKIKINASLTTPGPTNATDPCTCPKLLEVKRLDTKKLVLAIIIAFVVTQVANICIYGVVKYRGAETNCKNKQSAKNDDKNEDRQEYEVFPTTESHYTGLQLEARKEIVYADLSPPTVNNYSEIGTEKRSKQF